MANNKRTNPSKYPTKKRKKKRLRLRKGVGRFFVYFAFFTFMTIYIIDASKKLHAEFKYKKSYEYKLLEHGYQKEEISTLLNILDSPKIDYILANDYNEIYVKISEQKYYLPKNFDKYVEYKTYHPKTSYEDTISIVNVNANVGWYNETTETNIEDGDLMLVNKFHSLPSTYERDDIVPISLQYAYADQKASSKVIEAFEQMRNACLEALNVHLMINSSYRPYQDQEEIYNDYKRISLKYADSYAARPGFSEHQTGLAIDLTSLENRTAKDFTVSEEYAWLKEHCHEYGFILRYPEGKEYITGYNNESWHFRYVGINSATKMYEENLTLDEYYAFYIAN